jgi:mono/diheme cytochrome c family protein
MLRLFCIVPALSFGSFLLLALPLQTETQRLSADEAKKLRSPVPYTRKSIAQGKIAFARYCTACHGPDGKAQMDVVADATDLTSPPAYKNGTSQSEIFRSIRDGAGETMPPFKTQITGETDLWHLVNYIRSLWPDSTRPALEEGKEKDR